MMDHTQFEMLVAAVLASGIASRGDIKEPAEVVSLMLNVHKELTSREVITKQSAAFIPKGR